MPRVFSSLRQPVKRMAPSVSKSSPSLFASAYSSYCRCGSCSSHHHHLRTCRCAVCTSRHFSVKSQASYDIPKTQTAVVFEKNNAPLQVRKDWPVVQPEELKPGEVLVRLAYTCVCHTDLHIWLGDFEVAHKLPLVDGHEGAGYIAAIGDHSNTSLKVGDPVGVKWLANSCLGCEDCRKGHLNAVRWMIEQTLTLLTREHLTEMRDASLRKKPSNVDPSGDIQEVTR